MVGPAQGDPAQQLRVIEDLVAKKSSAIAVVPMDPSTIEGVLKRALERGIVVVTHEADTAKNTQADIEAFDNANKAYEKAKEILRKHPDIAGFQGSSAIDAIGIGRAVEEAGLQHKTC